MKKSISTALLVLTLSVPVGQLAYAGGGSSPKPTPAPAPAPDQNALIDLGLNLAIIYAKTDPRYSTILTALGINNATDLRAYLSGNGSGLNFQNIVARLAMLQAQKDPKVKSFLSSIGIKNETDLRNFLSSSNGGINFENVLALALTQAQSNSKYGVWLKKLNINSVDDIKRLMGGSGTSGNLQSLLVVVAMNYLESNPKYSKYVPYVQLVMATFGISAGLDGTGSGDSSDDDIIDLGPYNGMTIGEVKAVKAVK